MVLASKTCLSSLKLAGEFHRIQQGVAGYPVEFRYPLFSNCWMVACKPKGGKGLEYHNMIGEIDTMKSVNEKYVEIGELALYIKKQYDS